MSHFTQKKLKRKTRQELNEEGRRRKRMRKHKGKSAGHRTLIASNEKQTPLKVSVTDPRIGSKKPIPLLVDEPQYVTTKQQVITTDLSPEQELTQLENDPRLDQLLTRLEQAQQLTSAEHQYVEQKLARIEVLMAQLGIEF